jgi:REP element-mobilizing transposase RayT
MPRQPRLHVPNAFYHVTLRGNHRQSIFFSAADRDLLDSLTAEVLSRFAARLHAYCWMTSHSRCFTASVSRPSPRICGSSQRIEARQVHRSSPNAIRMSPEFSEAMISLAVFWARHRSLGRTRPCTSRRRGMPQLQCDWSGPSFTKHRASADESTSVDRSSRNDRAHRLALLRRTTVCRSEASLRERGKCHFASKVRYPRTLARHRRDAARRCDVCVCVCVCVNQLSVAMRLSQSVPFGSS